MLDELKKLNYPGSKECLIFFLQSIVGNRKKSLEDITVLCSHAPAGYHLHVDYLVEYCACFGWIANDEGLYVPDNLKHCLTDKNCLNRLMVESSLAILFENGVFKADMFNYDIGRGVVQFRNELLSLPFSSIRNVLVSQGFLTIERDGHKSLFFVNPDYEKELAKFCKQSSNALTLEQLKSKLEANSIAGAKAESFVVEYERRRISNPVLQRGIKQISEIDVCAGYDVLSFRCDSSTVYDRFIEVKAISRSMSFFWSQNELKVAKLMGDSYYLYLVDLSQISRDDYKPMILQNPALSVMESEEWFVEPESFRIQRI